MPLGALNGTAPFVTEAPFKLFEVVEGAVLTVAADSGDEVTAEVEVSTPTGRRFHYRVSAVANDLGIATLRVPYATDTDSPTRPTGPYRVRIGERISQVSVSDADVRGGRVVRVPR
jgi:asparagine N-glycosylation enzyme membrane subunit Stt3